MTDRVRPGDRSRRGSAMVGALFVVMTVAVLSVAYLQLSLSKNKEGKSAVDAKRAFYMAEAGLGEAFAAIRMGRSGNVGTAEEPAQYANGVFWVEATAQEENKVILRSTGLCGSGRSCLSVVVDKTASSVPSLGVFGDEEVVIEEGALVDSFDSRVGDYDELGYDPNGRREDEDGGEETEEEPLIVLNPKKILQPILDPLETGLLELADAVDSDSPSLPDGARIGCNGDITIEGGAETPTRILGDVHPGPEGSVVSDSGVLISGETTPAVDRVLLPPIEVPALASRGSYVHAGRMPYTVPGGEGSYETLRVTTGRTMVLHGPLELVVGQLVVDSGATLSIDASEGPVRLYVTEYLGLEQGSTLASADYDPSELALIVTADEWTDRNGDHTPDSPARMRSSGEFHGMVYAPEAEIAIASDLGFYGSIAARRVHILEGAQVHFDQALEDAVVEGLAIPQMIAWRIVELPEAEIVRSHLDPLVQLRIRGITPPKGEAAYIDTMLQAVFTCQEGHTHRYVGLKSDFLHRFEVASVLTWLETPAPQGPIDPPVDDFLQPIFGHFTATNFVNRVLGF